jgi:hypothetical protein
MLFAVACGNGTSSNIDLGSSGSCTGGVVVHQIVAGTYTPVAGTGAIVSDSCLTGEMGTDVEKSMVLQQTDSQSPITLLAADTMAILGSGPLRCNMGTLSYGPNPPMYTDNGKCRYIATNTVSFTVTSDTSFSVQVVQMRTNSTSDSGQTCPQPAASCTLTYKVNQKM